MAFDPFYFLVAIIAVQGTVVPPSYTLAVQYRPNWLRRFAPFFENLALNANSNILTPVKGVKGQSEVIKQRDKAANDLFSTAVSTVRQPIESLFNWLIEKTDIQRASKVRSTKGLLVHVFGKIAAAFIFLIFNS